MWEETGKLYGMSVIGEAQLGDSTSLPIKMLTYHLKYDLWTSSPGIIWELVKNAESQPLPDPLGHNMPFNRGVIHAKCGKSRCFLKTA